MTPIAPPPTALPVLAINIAPRLTVLDRWVVWRWQWDPRGERWTKPPATAVSGRLASSTDPTTWASFAAVLAAYATGVWDGIGLVLTPADGLTGLDLDHCLNPASGEIDPWALALIDRFASYTERSPSGTGIRIVVQGSLLGLLPNGRLGLRRGPLEIYSGGRYLTITGQVLNDPPLAVDERQNHLAGYVREIHSPPSLAPQQPLPIPASPPRRDDEDLLAAARAARNGSKFSALFDRGDVTLYDGDESRADQALLSLLALWTRDPDQLDRLFRRSALLRAKWERADYRARSIATALSGTVAWASLPHSSSSVRCVPPVRGRRLVVDLTSGGGGRGR